VLPFDPDDIAEPALVEKCVAVLEADRSLAYATTWSRFIDEHGRPREGPTAGYQPIGNVSSLMASENVGGAAPAVFRRRVFDRGFRYDPELVSYEDWLLYRRLHEAGWYGEVVPEALFRYRVRRDSMTWKVGGPNRERLAGELEAHARERAVQWVAPREARPR